MKVFFTGKKIESMEYSNTSRAAQVKLQVRVNVSVAKPNVVKKDTTILVRHIVMFGSPVDPFYILVRHVATYQVTDEEGLANASEEVQKRLINETCVPLATEKLNESLADICNGLGINPVTLPPALANNNNNSNLNSSGSDYTQNN